MSVEIVDVPPDVSRVTEGLRDTGYEFNTAVADIVDNSIAAGATLVDVRVGADYDGNMFVSVADNGHGMDRDALLNAMKYGSRRRADLASLGKFGLGLKTASTAFCRRLIVATRSSVGEAPLRAAWDLDAMAESNSWALHLTKASQVETEILDRITKGAPGTVVLWERIDRLLANYKRTDGKAFKNAVRRIQMSLEEHLATVYQRFLDADDDRARNVRIELNGGEVRAWDPFCIAETKAPTVERDQVVQLPDGSTTTFKVRAFILPRKEEFSSEELRASAKISNELQGVYVYREGRLIHGPDWLGMYKQEPHFSLLRVELSFDHRLDEAFQVDIKKSRILLNDQLYEWLRDKFLASPRREAEVRYRKGVAATVKGAATLLHTASNTSIHQKVETLKTAQVTGVRNDGTVVVTNNAGQGNQARLRIVTQDDKAAVHVNTAETLDSGVLWEAALVNGGAAVTLNTSHPFYPKAYIPNKANSAVVQAMDFLLWSLAQAELNNISAINRDAFEEFRIEVSRNLKKLVADLPDPPEA